MSKDLAIVMPVYNEEGCIQTVLADWIATLTAKKISFEILVINDGSSDNTASICQKVALSHPQVSLFSKANGGHGSALYLGYEKALERSPGYIFQVDSDNQFLASDFPLLWDEKINHPMIFGYRKIRKDPLMRKLLSLIMKLLLFILFLTWIKDPNTPYRLMKASLFRKIWLKLPSGYFAPNIFISVICAKLGYGPYYLPVQHKDRRTGTNSLLNFGLFKPCLRSFVEILIYRIKNVRF